MNLGLEGKVAVVTGASAGIGLAVTRALTKEGVHVVAGARESSAELDVLVATGVVQTVSVDLSTSSGPIVEIFAVAAPGVPPFQAAAANLNQWTEAKVDTENTARGPMLIVSGEKDHIVPRAISDATYKRQQRNEGVTEFIEIPNRGHTFTIDNGWREVADTALQFIQRFVS